MPKGYRADGTPNGTGYDHGGNGKTAEEVKRMEKAYAEARVQGKTDEAARAIAGYSPNQPLVARPPGGAVDRTIKETLDEHGIDDNFIANEYLDGLQRSKLSGAKDAAFSAHAQYLKQLGYLLGHRKDSPQVAVQINNQSKSTGELDAERIKTIVGLLEEEIANRQPDGIHAEGARTPNPEAREGVAEPPGNPKATGDRGQP